MPTPKLPSCSLITALVGQLGHSFLGNLSMPIGNMGMLMAFREGAVKGEWVLLLRVVMRLLPRLVATLVPENVPGWVDIKGREVGEAGLGWRLEEGSP